VTVEQPTFEVIELADLLPSGPVESTLAEVEIGDILYDDVGPSPSRELIENIRVRGVRTPVTIMHADGGVYQLVAGRRRLLAALACGLTYIPAIIETGESIASAALSDHALRRENPAADLKHIESLLDLGYSDKQIAQATGLTLGTIRSRLRLRDLHPALREALDEGAISMSVAEQARKLPLVEQEALAIQLDQDGKLTTKDVNERRHVQIGEAVTALPADFLGDEPSTPQTEGGDTLDDLAAMFSLSIGSSQGLARLGIILLDAHRYDDVKVVLQRIIDSD
jgi:ParB/RepB/Spo0J family partition protein